MRGEDDHGDVRIDGSNSAQNLDSIHFRHHQVEDDDVVFTLSDFLLGKGWIAECLYDKPILFEEGLHVFADGWVIINDEYSYGRNVNRHGFPPAPSYEFIERWNFQL